MKPERWQQIEQLCQTALDREPDQRATFLNQACAGDEELQREIESLLAYQGQAAPFIETPALLLAADLLAGGNPESIVGHRFGPYEVLSLLGAGGMGEVYLAQDERLKRRVAIKVLPAAFTKDDERVRRFVREAQAASVLNHPNIITIHEIGQIDGVHYIVVEFIEGQTLRHQVAGARMEIRGVVEVAAQVASALAAAHAAGIMHRDIKPENVMIRPDGLVKVLDFGLAKLTESATVTSDAQSSAVSEAKTEPGRVMGTARYMSPEQARGQKVDGRSDIFSLGVVLYELVAGRSPFEGETTSDVLAAILVKEPQPLAHYSPEIPEELQRIITKTLQKERGQRYQTAQELLADLKSLQQEIVRQPKRGHVRGSTSHGSARAVTAKLGAARATSSIDALLSALKRHRGTAGLALAIFVASAACLAYFKYSATGAPAITSIAVLPFASADGNPEAQALSDGLSESLIDSLSLLPQLKVIAHGSSFTYKNKEIDPQEVAQTLGVRVIVMGRIVQAGDRLTVHAELVDAREKTQLWGEQYIRKARDVQAVQEEIAHAISEKLRVRLTGTQKQQLAKRATENAEAYQLYLNGQFYSRKGGIANWKKALGYFTEAVNLDPNFALAHVAVAGRYNALALNSALAQNEVLPKAKMEALKALDLDESLAGGHVELAQIKQNDWDWAGAEREYQRALELNPNLPILYERYSLYLSIMGRHAEALSRIKQAQELEPLGMSPRVLEGLHLSRARRFDEGIAKLQQVIKLEPDHSQAHFVLGWAYAGKGQWAEAVLEYQKRISIEGETGSLCFLGQALAMAGRRSEARAILNKLETSREYVALDELAYVYAGLGEKDRALDTLERAYGAHLIGLQFLRVDPLFDSLRSEPRFADLLRRVGLTE